MTVLQVVATPLFGLTMKFQRLNYRSIVNNGSAFNTNNLKVIIIYKISE